MAIWTLLGGAILSLAGSQVSGGELDEQAPALQPKMIWSVSDVDLGLAIDNEEGIIYSISFDGTVMAVDAEGQAIRSFQTNAEPSAAGIARLIKGGRREIFTFGIGDYGVKGYDADGKRLWAFDVIHGGVIDAQAIDLDDDGLDEVVTGYLGGLQVLDSSGNLLWKDTSLRNVFHVCAGDINGDGQMEVAAIQSGVVHVYDAQGAKIETHDLRPFGIDLLEVADVENQGCALLIGGRDLRRRQNVLMGLAADGQQVWSIKSNPVVLGSRLRHTDSATVAESKPWLAMGMDDGVVHVVDIAKGMIVATIRDQGRPEVGWLEVDPDSDPILVTMTQTALNAFRLEEKPRED